MMALEGELAAFILEELKLIRKEIKEDIGKLGEKLELLMKQTSEKTSVDDDVEEDVDDVTFCCNQSNNDDEETDQKSLSSDVTVDHNIIDLTDCFDDIEVPAPYTSPSSNVKKTLSSCEEENVDSKQEELENTEQQCFGDKSIDVRRWLNSEVGETFLMDVAQDGDAEVFKDADQSTSGIGMHSEVNHSDLAPILSTEESSCNKRNKDKCYQCSFCDKIFFHRAYLTRHQRIHTGDRPFICMFCNKSFARQSHLKRHIITHTGEKPYQCDICKKFYADKAALVRHLQVHVGDTCGPTSDLQKTINPLHEDVDRSFMCHVCDRSFRHQSQAIAHLRTHTGERPYECSFCCKTFQRKDHRNRHERTHTGEKPYKCKLCSVGFADISGLRGHSMQKHGGADNLSNT